MNLPGSPDYNPYAPPKAALGPTVVAGAYWREGALLMIHPTAELPPRCVRCNADALMPVKVRTLRWHHPGWYAFVLVNLLIYALVAAFVRTTLKVKAGLCGLHTRDRRRNLALVWGVSLLALVSLAGSGLLRTPALGMVPALLLLVAAAVFGQRTRVVWIRTATKEVISLGGCGEAFLASLPQRPG